MCQCLFRRPGRLHTPSDRKTRLLWRQILAQRIAYQFDWFPSDANPQHFIATWELLAQVALLFCLTQLLPVGHLPLHVVFRTDNSASESASWKGLIPARGMCHVLRMFQLLQHRVRVSVHLDSVPGFLNDTANQLSRGTNRKRSSLCHGLPFPRPRHSAMFQTRHRCLNSLPRADELNLHLAFPPVGRARSIHTWISGQIGFSCSAPARFCPAVELQHAVLFCFPSKGRDLFKRDSAYPREQNFQEGICPSFLHAHLSRRNGLVLAERG